MPYTLTMPKLSPTMEDGKLATWHKSEGDFVESGELLFEVATDKATIEYNSFQEGYLRKILIPKGNRAYVNEPVAIFSEEKSEDITSFEVEAFTPPGTEEESKDVTEKEEESPKSSTPSNPSVRMSAPAFIPEAPLVNYQFEFPEGKSSSYIKASPLAKKLASEKGIDLSAIKGSGPRGRIVASDVENREPSMIYTGNKAPEVSPGTYELEELTPMKEAVGTRLQESKSFIPHFYVTQLIGVETLLSTRAQLKEMGLKVTLNDLMIRAVALALKKHPEINSGYHSVENKIIRFKTIDISVAVGLNEGLITPIIRHADYKSISEISQQVKELASRAKEGKLLEHEYKGGSFTLSNLGMYGVHEFQAIINPPQAAILAVAGTEDYPIQVGNRIELQKKMKVTLSCDHRVLDGKDAALFLNTLKELIEHPAVLLI